MVDIESSSGNSTSDGLNQFVQCTCDKLQSMEICEACMKHEEGSSGLARLSSEVYSQHPSATVLSANVLMLFSVLLYSGNAVVIRKYMLLGGNGPGFLFLRSMVSIPFFLIAYGYNYRKNRSIIVLNENNRTNLVMIIGCIAGGIRQSLLPFIVNKSEASTLGIISPSVPLVTAVISHIFNMEKLTKITVLCLFISTFGLIFGLDLINKFTSAEHIAYYLLLLVPITKSFQVVFLKMASDKFDPIQLLANQVLASILICLPTSLMASISQSESASDAYTLLFRFTFKQFLCSLYSVLAILFLAWRLQIYCLKILGATIVSLFQTLRPFFTMLLGAMILSEDITLRKSIGSLIVCVALVIYQKTRIRTHTVQN